MVFLRPNLSETTVPISYENFCRYLGILKEFTFYNTGKRYANWAPHSNISKLPILNLKKVEC